MTDRTAQDKPRGVIPRLFYGAFCIVLYLFFSLIFSLVVEWAGIAFDYWEANHAYHVLKKELVYVSHIESHPVLKMNVYTEAMAQVNGFYESVEKTVLRDYLYGSNAISNIIRPAVWVVQVFLVRLTVIVFAIPMFILVGIVALINGLDERDIRKFEGGTESSLIYDIARPLMMATVFISSVIYLSFPFQINPAVIYLPAMAGLYYAVYTTSSMFMKNA